MCFGHQLFAYVFGRNITHDKSRAKTGTFQVRLIESAKNEPLLYELPNDFYANYMHQDAIVIKPDEATILASGERCKCAILKYGKNSYTTQFHPELDANTIKLALKAHPEYLPDKNVDLDEVLGDATESEKILRNFITRL